MDYKPYVPQLPAIFDAFGRYNPQGVARQYYPDSEVERQMPVLTHPQSPNPWSFNQPQLPDDYVRSIGIGHSAIPVYAQPVIPEEVATPAPKKPKKVERDTPNGPPMDTSGAVPLPPKRPQTAPASQFGSLDEHMAAIMAGKAPMPAGMEGLKAGLLSDGTSAVQSYDLVRNALAPQYGAAKTKSLFSGLLGE